MSGKRIDFERNLHLIEEFGSFFHDWHIAGATHDNTYKRVHYS
jgi:hypothetical protein